MFENSLISNPIGIGVLLFAMTILAFDFVLQASKILLGNTSSIVRLKMLALLYGIGTICKVLVIGPAELRWYVGDIGLPATIGLFLAWALMPHSEWDKRAKLADREISMIFAGGLLVLYEVGMGVARKAWGYGLQVDAIDITIYALGTLLAICFVRRERRLLRWQDSVRRIHEVDTP